MKFLILIISTLMSSIGFSDIVKNSSPESTQGQEVNSPYEDSNVYIKSNETIKPQGEIPIIGNW